MRTRFLAAALAAVAVTTFIPATTAARGLADTHKQERVGGYICMTDHWHNGQSGAWATKAKAQQVAIRSWQGLVRIEYGRAWADYRIALHKKMTCSAAERGQTSCVIMARPCRR